MRFFKHQTDAHRNPSLLALFDALGHVGIACYWILLEMCAERMSETEAWASGRQLQEDDFVFDFHPRIVRQNLRLSLAKVQLLLGQCSTLGLLSAEISEKKIKISVPKLLKYLERGRKKSVKLTSARRPSDVLEKEKEKEKENTPIVPRENTTQTTPPDSLSVCVGEEEKTEQQGKPTKQATHFKNTDEEQGYKTCQDTWLGTIKHFKGHRGILPHEQDAILRSIRAQGIENTRLALFGARFEPATQTFRPGEHLDIRRVLGPQFLKNVGRGDVHKPTQRALYNPEAEIGQALKANPETAREAIENLKGLVKP